MPRPRTSPESASGPLTLLQAMEVTRWYETFAPKLRGVLVHRGVADQDMDDVLQDMFVRVIEYAPHLARLDETHRRNYVYRIAESILMDRARRFHARYAVQAARTLGSYRDADVLPQMQPVTASHDWIAQTHPEQTTEARLSLQRIWDLTPEPCREIIALMAQGYDQEHIAAHLGITVQAIKNRLNRLRHHLLKMGEQVA